MRLSYKTSEPEKMSRGELISILGDFFTARAHGFDYLSIIVDSKGKVEIPCTIDEHKKYSDALDKVIHIR